MQPLVVGRHPEQRAIAALVAQAAAGISQVIGIEGPPGIGKSTLLDDAVAALDGWTVLRCHQDASRSKFRLGAITELFGPAGWSDDGAADEPASTARDLREILEASDDSVCLVVEDAQWLDQPSRDVLLQLTRQTRDLPVLFLVSNRPLGSGAEDAFARVAREPSHGRWIELGPLARDGVRDMLVQRLGVEPDSQTLERIDDVTGGYPIHVAELIHRLGASDDPIHTLTTTLSELRGAPADRLLSERVGASFGQLSPESRAAHLAVCLAEQLTWEEACLAVEERGLSAPRTSEVLQTGFVTRGLRDRLRPRHAMLAQALVDQADSTEIRETHLALGKVLSGTPSLRHRVRAARSLEDDPSLVAELEHRSLEHLILGDAELAFALGFEAARLDPTKVGAAAITGMRVRRPDLVVSLEDMARSEPEPLRHKALKALVLACRQDGTDAAHLVGQVDPGECDDETLTLLAYAAHEACRRAVAEGDFGKGRSALVIRDELARRRQVALDSGLPPEFLGEYSALVGLLSMWGLMTDLDPRDGRELIASTKVLEQELQEWPRTEPVLAVVRAVRCSFMFFSGIYDEAMQVLEPVADPPVLDADFILQITQTRFQLLFQAGRWDQAQVSAGHALGRTLERLNDVGRLRLAAASSAVTRCRGELETLREEHAPRAWSGQILVGAARAVADAWAWVATGGDAATVAAHLDRAWADGPGGTYGGGLPTAVLAVRAHMAAGEEGAARAIFDQLGEGWYDETVRAYLTAHCEALLLAGTKPDRAAERFAEASVAMLRHLAEQPECGLHLYRAVLAEDWGAHLLGHRWAAPPELEQDLRAAIATIREAGAAEWRDRLARLQRRLHELDPLGGGGPGLRLVAGPDILEELTSREREIAWLVADGLSNKEIAGVLFLSVRTVEHHVANALRKLECPSRIELRQVLRARSGRVS